MNKEKKDSFIDKQKVRLLDVFVVAPFLVYAATLKHSPKWVRVSLLFIAATTLGYNGLNYLEEATLEKKKKKDGKQQN